MFSKISLQSFVYDLIDIFMFPNNVTKKIYDQYKVQKCFFYQNLPDTDSTCVFFLFICELGCAVDEKKSRQIIFEVMIKSKMFNQRWFLGSICCSKKKEKKASWTF